MVRLCSRVAGSAERLANRLVAVEIDLPVMMVWQYGRTASTGPRSLNVTISTSGFGSVTTFAIFGSASFKRRIASFGSTV
jgi:hypothetical protein